MNLLSYFSIKFLWSVLILSTSVRAEIEPSVKMKMFYNLHWLVQYPLTDMFIIKNL